MKIILSQSQDAKNAYTLVTNLQERLVTKLDSLSHTIGEDKEFQEVTWLRDEGIHGGGNRFEVRDEKLFNTASINVSQVHYDDLPQQNLLCASAISTIIHPRNPNVPSFHMHISFTQLRDGSSYWRVMADLNPSIYNEEDKNSFDLSLQKLTQELYAEGKKQGDKYFDIPLLERKRGVSHFYLENYFTDSKEKDFEFAKEFGKGIIDTYINIITPAMQTRASCSSKDIKTQLEYHTLYLFQVLTLDRGTTAGLLVHNQNDLGIMGSLPSYVNKSLLLSWAEHLEAPQNELVREIANAINLEGKIDTATKTQFAAILRAHYKKYPQALSLQASGDIIPTTVGNHAKP